MNMNRMVAESLFPMLPRLRRYAAAVTGSSRTGDRYLELCLETLIQEPQRLASRRDLAVQLFKLLNASIDACGPENETAADVEFESGLGPAILRLARVDRRLLLLTLLEDFSLDRAAEILALPVRDARRRLAASCVALRDVCVARILVIQGKRSLADDLADRINQSGHTLVGVATDTRSAAALAQRRHPDLVVADLHRGMGGIGPVRAMLEGDTMPIVFVGGRPAALRQRGGTPIFVIDDPRNAQMLEDAINRALFSRVARSDMPHPVAGI
jgi:DNA-directed RNA polymerase specialized sigma24 family protein/CheY-like chemotaxis protein